MNIDQIISTYIKPLILAIYVGLLSVITSTLPSLIGLFVLWNFNFFMGLGADAKCGKNFCMDKAFNSFKQLILVGMLMIVVYAIPYLMKDAIIAERGVKYLTYMSAYFFLTNISKNGKQIWPNWQFIVFLHELLSTQLFFQLKNYLGIKGTKK